jgi:hypothetical protein
MRYTKPQIVTVLDAKKAIQSVKEPSIPTDGHPDMRTPSAYVADE